jgi:hypothetical protein
LNAWKNEPWDSTNATVCEVEGTLIVNCWDALGQVVPSTCWLRLSSSPVSGRDCTTRP